MRKLLPLVIAFVLLVSMPLQTASAQGTQEDCEWKVLHNGAKLYKSASIAEDSNVLALLEQSAVITLLNTELIKVDRYSFYFVEANGIQGYVLASDIYYSRKEYVYDIVYKTVVTPNLFGKAKIYRYPDIQSEIIGDDYKDGQRVSVVKSTEEYGEFEKIVYREGYAYMQSASLTNGLSKGQSIAVAIASIVLALAALTAFLFIKAKKRLHSFDKEVV